MPASANIKTASEAALRAANDGFQSIKESGPVFDKDMTAALATKHMGATILKSWKSGAGTAYSYIRKLRGLLFRYDFPLSQDAFY